MEELIFKANINVSSSQHVFIEPFNNICDHFTSTQAYIDLLKFCGSILCFNMYILYF